MKKKIELKKKSLNFPKGLRRVKKLGVNLLLTGNVFGLDLLCNIIDTDDK